MSAVMSGAASFAAPARAAPVATMRSAGRAGATGTGTEKHSILAAATALPTQGRALTGAALTRAAATPRGGAARHAGSGRRGRPMPVFAIDAAQARVGTFSRSRSRKHQLTTASVVHATNLTAGSEQPSQGVRSKAPVDDSQYGPGNQSDTRECQPYAQPFDFEAKQRSSLEKKRRQGWHSSPRSSACPTPIDDSQYGPRTQSDTPRE
jgi:hypothetical protein